MNTLIETLLMPISEEHPCGESPRNDNSFTNRYYQLKNLRQQARLAERQRMQQSDAELLIPAEWREVAELAIQVLQEQTKDLEVASWLVEAWIRIQGFEGLLDGLNLLTAFIEKYDSELSHDASDELELQLATVQGLSGEQQPGTMIMPLMSQPITQASGKANVAMWQYQQAVEISQLIDEEARKKRLAQGGVEFSQVQQAAKLSPLEFGTSLQQTITFALEALCRCDEMFTIAYAEHAPSWHYLRQTLENIQHTLALLYTSHTPAPIAKTDKVIEKDSSVTVSTVIQNREAVLTSVAEAADFFLKHEPHSPVIYLLQQAVRWAGLSLPELMQEICLNSQDYFAYCRMTGIPVMQKEIDEGDDD